MDTIEAEVVGEGEEEEEVEVIAMAMAEEEVGAVEGGEIIKNSIHRNCKSSYDNFVLYFNHANAVASDPLMFLPLCYYVFSFV